jgi:pimeloyl-ACP methyl ester carboxylesterase
VVGVSLYGKIKKRIEIKGMEKPDVQNGATRDDVTLTYHVPRIHNKCELKSIRQHRRQLTRCLPEKHCARKHGMNHSLNDDVSFIDVGAGEHRRKIAVRVRTGSQESAAPGLFWLGGFHSDMMGTKAIALDAWAAEHQRNCVRFDYSGHGESGGAFADGTIGRWLEESLAVFDAFCLGPQVVIGSSMGGWMALLMARALARRGDNVPRATLAGVVLIAPAPDFTEELMWKNFSPEIREQLQTTGVWLRPSDYGEPYPITRQLIEEGRNHLLLGGTIDVGCPVRILQGAKDPDVPWQHAFALTHCLPSDDVVLTLVQDGDHRLSRPQDIARMLAAVEELS